MFDRSIFFSLVFAVVAGIISHFLGIVDLDYFNTPEYKLFNALNVIINSHGEQLFKRAAVGFGAHVLLSIEKNDLPLFSSSVLQDADPQRSFKPQNKSDLQQTFLYFYKNDLKGKIELGRELFGNVMTEVQNSKHSIEISGQGVKFAEVFAGNDVQVLIGSSFDDDDDDGKLTVKKSQLNFKSDHFSTVEKCQFNPSEDVALNVYWGPNDGAVDTSGAGLPRRGNRVILNANTHPHTLECWHDFFKSSNQFNYDLMVITGLERLQNLPDEEIDFRLNRFAQYLSVLTRNKPVHLEMSDFSNSTFTKKLVDVVLHLFNSVGLSEDSIISFNQAINGPHSDIESDVGIAVAGGVSFVNDILYHVISKYGTNVRNSKLTRLFFHCSSFQVTATKGSRWSDGDTKAAAAKASLAATGAACNGVSLLSLSNKRLAMPSYFTLSKIESNTVAALNVNNPVIEWKKTDDVTFFIVPVLVCLESNRYSNTAAISASATALLNSRFGE